MCLENVIEFLCHGCPLLLSGVQGDKEQQVGGRDRCVWDVDNNAVADVHDFPHFRYKSSN